MPAKKTNLSAKTEKDCALSELVVEVVEGADEHRATANKLLQPEVRAALLIQKFDSYLDVNALATGLKTQTTAIVAGDMSRAEAMLGAQAHTLDALFCTLARRAHSNMTAGYGDAAERYLKLALKAQSQSVRTLEALGELKNPKQIAFVAQANIANGHQQVNNGHTPQAGKNKTKQNKLSEGVGNELLPDTRTPSNAGAVNQAMETLGTLDRCENPRGKGQGVAERI